MNDTELNRLLDAWQAPAPRRGFRDRLRARFPRSERRMLGRPLRWVLAIGLASAALAVGMQNDATVTSRAAAALAAVWDHLVAGFEMHRVGAMVWQIRRSDARVFIDGNAGGPLRFSHAMVFDLDVPGDGVYSVTFSSKPLSGWTRAGQIKGTYLEFEAGKHHVVVALNEKLLISDSPILVRRRETK